ncbi:MAG: M23 family metallopeptidase [bacterium]
MSRAERVRSILRAARGLALLLALPCVLLWGCGARGPAPAVDADEVPELVGVWYVVEHGDSVSSIAQRHGVPVEDVVELNGIVDPDKLEVGQPLFLYGIDELLERRSRAVAGGAASASGKSGGAKPAGAAKPAGGSSGGKAGGGGRFVWPVDAGTLTSGFGRRGRRIHKGIDLAADPGTPIKAAAAGEVIYSDNKQRGYGNLVIIQHADDFVTVYAHNRRNLVDEGETVGQGAVIAELGNTGRSTGPHLHFEIRLKSKAVDPLIYLPAR